MQNLIEDIKQSEKKAQNIIEKAKADSIKEIEIGKSNIDKLKSEKIVETNKKIGLFEKQSDIEIQKEIDVLQDINRKEIEKLKNTNTKNVSEKLISKILEV